VNFYTLQVDDVSILKPELIKEKEHVPDTGFKEITKRDFETHLYGSIYRCRFQNRILSFVSSEKEATGLLLFFFAHNGRYFRVYRDRNVADAALDKQIMNYLYPDTKSFNYQGWLCKYVANDGLFHLYTPNELEQPAGFRISEMEVSTSAQAIEFINGY
jgi:hypothetical protein